MPFAERRDAYACDVDVRDQLGVRVRLPARQHGRRARGEPSSAATAYAIVDEVDSILDRRGADAAHHLRRAGDRGVDLRPSSRSVASDDSRVKAADPQVREGRRTRPRALRRGLPLRREVQDRLTGTRPRSSRSSSGTLGIDNLYDPSHVLLVNHLTQALKARSRSTSATSTTSSRTARSRSSTSSPAASCRGRRWSEGLHQAIEAEEQGVPHPRGERHPRHDHPPELLPPLREARRA